MNVSEKKRVSVVGLGYVGLTTAAVLARLGHSVVGLDNDSSKVATLARGAVPIYEENLDVLLMEGVSEGRLTFTDNVADGVNDSDFVFLCLPTPQGDDGGADLSYLLAACRDIAPHVTAGTIIVNKSTVPVGSAEMVTKTLNRSDVHVMSSPEFLREGSAVHDSLNPDRIVIGSDDILAAKTLASLYSSIDSEVIITDPRSAETIKYVANAYLATRLTFVNTVATLCDHIGADVRSVLRGVGADHRIGPHHLRPGPGWGGSCFPKDSQALVRIADQAGYDFLFLKSVISENERHFDSIASRILGLMSDTCNVVAVLGLTFKAGTDDLRDSPSLAIIRRLIDEGVRVRAYDPLVPPHRVGVVEGVNLLDTALEACSGVSVVAVLTEWPEFASLNPQDLLPVMSGRCAIDTRGILDLSKWRSAGFTCLGLGRPERAMNRLGD